MRWARRQAVVLGAAEDATATGEFLAASARVVHKVQTDWAYHTMLQPFDRQEFVDDLKGITPGPIRLPFYSSEIGGRLPENAILDASHWYWGVGRPFYYGSALAAALRDGYRVILNVSPDPLMSGTIRQMAAAHGVPVRLIDSMRAGEPDLTTWLGAKRELRGRVSDATRRRRPRAAAEETADALAARLVLTDPEFVRGPGPYLERLREAGPVHHLPREGCWLAVDYDAVRSVLMNPADYSNRDMAGVEPVLVGADGEVHRVTRRALAPRFSGDAIRSLGGYAEEAAERLLTPVVGKPEFDVVRELTTPLTALVAGRLLELDEAPALELHARAGGPPRPTAVGMASARPIIGPLVGDMPLYAELRGEHGYDHTAAVSLLTLLWVAATSSSSIALGACVLRLTDHAVRREIKSRPERLPGFIEECLRLDPPAPVITRRTVRDVTLAGVELAAHSPVLLMLSAANRDPARFEDPDRLILDRPNTRHHLTFAVGPHHCLGAPLARAEIKAALTVLLGLMPDFELVQPRHTVRYSGASVTRTLEALTITSS